MFNGYYGVITEDDNGIRIAAHKGQRYEGVRLTPVRQNQLLQYWESLCERQIIEDHTHGVDHENK